MSKRKRRSFTDEFKAQAVALVLKCGKAVTEVARDLDLVPSALGDWVKKAKALPTPAQKVLEDLRISIVQLPARMSFTAAWMGTRRSRRSSAAASCLQSSEMGNDETSEMASSRIMER